MFKPDVTQMTTPIRVQHRTEVKVNGQPDISYISEEEIGFCNFKALHGTESIQAGVAGVSDGGTVTMWYDPAVTAKDRILLNDNPAKAYEIITEPENVEMRNQFLIFKVSRVVNA